MYQEIKIGIAFLLGAGCGVLGTRKYFQTKYDKIANEEIESVKEALSHRSGHIIEETSIEEPEKFAQKIIEESKDNQIRVYSTLDNLYSAPQQKNTIHEYVEQLAAEAEHPEDDRPEDCYEVSELDYSETALGYDKLVLHYYIDDDMLVNADNGDWTAQDIGPEGLERIRNSDEAELYFRNDPTATDYQVIRIKGTYYIEM